MLLLTYHLEDHETILPQVSTPSLAMEMLLHMALVRWTEQEHRESLKGTTQERYKVQDNHSSNLHYQGTSEEPMLSLRQSLNMQNYQHNNSDR